MKILKLTEFCTLFEEIAWYVNYISIRIFFFKKKEKRSSLSPHSPSSTTLFFVLLKSKTFWKSCFYLLSLLSHLFPSCIIIIIVIVIIVVTKLVLLFWSHRCKEMSYSYCSTCEYHLQCGQGPFVLYFVLYPSLLISTLLSLSTKYTHKFVCLSTWICIIFLRRFYCTVLKTVLYHSHLETTSMLMRMWSWNHLSATYSRGDFMQIM